MQFDWKCFFEILNAVWDVSQKEIAEYLDVRGSTITRLKKNEIAKSRLTVAKMYKCLFDLTNTKSMAHSKAKDPTNNEKEILHAWHNEITDRKLIEMTKDLQSNDYQPFFKGLLKLLLENTPNISVNQPNTLDNNVQIPKRHRDIKAEPEKIPDELYQSFNAYNIDAFIECAPTDYPQYIIEDATNFIGHVNPDLRRYNRDQKNEDYEKSPLYPQIKNFTECLEKYLAFLKECCVDPRNFPYSFELKHDIGERFLQETDIHLKKLKTLYSDIKIAIKVERDRYFEERRALSKIFNDH